MHVNSLWNTSKEWIITLLVIEMTFSPPPTPYNPRLMTFFPQE